MRSLRFAVGLSQWLLACSLALGNAVAHAGPVPCGDKPIRLALYENGNFYFSDGRQTQGIDKDVVDELIKRSACKFDVQVMTRARIWADLATGDLDMSVSGIRNPERDKFAWFANYLILKNYVVMQSGAAHSAPTAASFLQQRKLQFGAVRTFKHGAQQDKLLDDLRAEQRVQDSANTETLFRKLKEGRIDALFSQPPVYRKYIQDMGLQNDVTVLDWTPGEKGVVHGMVLAKSHFTEADAKQWQALLVALRSDGTLKRIYTRYLSASEAAALLDF